MLEVRRWEHYTALLEQQGMQVADIAYLDDIALVALGVTALGPRKRMSRSCAVFAQQRHARSAATEAADSVNKQAVTQKKGKRDKNS